MSGSAGVSTLSPVRHNCPARAAEDALLLLTTGRADMARVVLERLPGLVRDALASPATERARVMAEAKVARLRAEARDLDARLARARRDLADVEAALTRRRRELAREPQAAPARPRRAKPHHLLAEALSSGRVTADEVAALLKLTPRNVEEITTGKVGLAASAWKRVVSLVDSGVQDAGSQDA